MIYFQWVFTHYTLNIPLFLYWDLPYIFPTVFGRNKLLCKGSSNNQHILKVKFIFCPKVQRFLCSLSRVLYFYQIPVQRHQPLVLADCWTKRGLVMTRSKLPCELRPVSTKSTRQPGKWPRNSLSWKMTQKNIPHWALADCVNVCGL